MFLKQKRKKRERKDRHDYTQSFLEKGGAAEKVFGYIVGQKLVDELKVPLEVGLLFGGVVAEHAREDGLLDVVGALEFLMADEVGAPRVGLLEAQVAGVGAPDVSGAPRARCRSRHTRVRVV